MNEVVLTEKYKAFLLHRATVEFLEGTTAAGKTTVGAVKFFLRVAESEQSQHILAGLDIGTIEKNIINPDFGIMDIFGGLVDYAPHGKGGNTLPHIVYKTVNGPKMIYVLGYDNKARWKKALGGQYGCVYIDELNIADIDFVREATMRCDYLIGTLNPDDPNLPIYSEYINHSRPAPGWIHDTPKELLEQLDQPYKEGWTHWYFSFRDNGALSQEKLDQIVSSVPKGTKLYKNKILGLRGKATGLVFSNFSPGHIVTEKDIKELATRDKFGDFSLFSCGVDTAYSAKSPDTVSFIFQGITSKGYLFVLDEEVYNNTDLFNPLAPSDVVNRLVDFLERMRKKWGFSRNVFIDNADQATMMELRKHRRTYGSIYNFINAYKKVGVIDRIHIQLGWIASGHYLVNASCQHHIDELNTYSWKEDKYEPEDSNDHTINASQYAFIPFRTKIGIR